MKTTLPHPGTTTLLGIDIDVVAKHLFGTVDQRGAKAIDALIKNDLVALHALFNDFFFFLDAHKVRTPRGEVFIGYKDGTVHYQDAFGRTTKEWQF
jgi:hypothetical protein